MSDQPEPRRLRRSRSDRKAAGVLGGIAEYWNIDPSLVRILYVVLTILTGFVPLVFMYLVMAFIIPDEPRARPN
jgi:phage shock protein PspC (stress-responsive transcriptional regulator)